MLRVNLRITVYLYDAEDEYGDIQPEKEWGIPDVLLIKKRALVRFAKPSIFNVPMNDVLIVLTALN